MNAGRCLLLLSVSLLFSCSHTGNNDPTNASSIPTKTSTVTVPPPQPPKAKFDRNNVADVKNYLQSWQFACYDLQNTAMILQFGDDAMHIEIKPLNTSAATDNSQINTQGEEGDYNYQLAAKVSYQGSIVQNPATAISLHNWNVYHCDQNAWSHDLCRVYDTSGVIDLFIKSKWYRFSPSQQIARPTNQTNVPQAQTSASNTDNSKGAKADNTSQLNKGVFGSAEAISDRAYFYKQDDIRTKTKAYMVKGEKADYTRDTGGDFIYVEFTNPQGIVTKGWMLKSDFQLVPKQAD